MAISHELSGEIAIALFEAKERSPLELKDLKEMVFEIHSTLEQLTDDSRSERYESPLRPNRFHEPDDRRR